MPGKQPAKKVPKAKAGEVRKGISTAEFARREGCTAQNIIAALKAGKIVRLKDGSIDPKLVGTWRKRGVNAAENQRRKRAEAEPDKFIGVIDDLDDPEPDTQDAAFKKAIKQAEKDPLMMNLQQASTLKEVYVAMGKKREHDESIKLVVMVEDVAKKLGEEYATIRTRLLSIPPEHAPKICRLKTPAEVQDYLLTIITETLNELSDEADAT